MQCRMFVKAPKADKENNMVVPVPTEVIPIWFIEKWKKENAESNSPLEYFLETMIKDWHIEETRQKGDTANG